MDMPSDFTSAGPPTGELKRPTNLLRLYLSPCVILTARS